MVWLPSSRQTRSSFRAHVRLNRVTVTDEDYESQIEPENGHRAKEEVRVLLVNSRDVVRRGLRAVLEDADDLVVAAETDTLSPGDGVVLAAVEPDVAIVDLGDGIDAARRSLRVLQDAEGSIPAVILGHDGDETLRAAAVVHAAAVLFDDAHEADVREVVRRVAREEPPVPPVPIGRVARDLVDLTFREGQVLRLIAEGLTNREIAVRLGLAEKTVKNYASAIFAKLHIEHRTQAVIYALTHAPHPDGLRR